MKRAVSVLLGVSALAVVPSGAQAKNVEGHEVRESPSEVRAYWTEERMRGARARDARQPKGKPGGGGSGGFTSGAVQLINGAYAGDMAKNGKVFFTENGVNYVCSGTSIATGTGQAVWTAGHCVNEGGGAGRFATNWQFVPGYKDGAAPYGAYPATRLYTTSAWRSSGDFSYDLGAATVSGNLFGTVGGRNIATNYAVNSAFQVTSYGYPAAGKFNGERQYFCTSGITRRDSGNPQPMGMGCNMTGGSSGGGWINSGNVVSVNSYGYSSLKNVMFGPYQNSVSDSLASCARASTCSGIPGS